MPKRIVWAMFKKKRKKRKISMPKGMREKNAKEHEEKKRKKQRNKDSPYFQIKGIYPKERES